jgi:hypothetical protein
MQSASKRFGLASRCEAALVTHDVVEFEINRLKVETPGELNYTSFKGGSIEYTQINKGKPSDVNI